MRGGSSGLVMAVVVRGGDGDDGGGEGEVDGDDGGGEVDGDDGGGDDGYGC